jgi:hypothetical protein
MPLIFSQSIDFHLLLKHRTNTTTLTPAAAARGPKRIGQTLPQFCAKVSFNFINLSIHKLLSTRFLKEHIVVSVEAATLVGMTRISPIPLQK